MRAVSVEVFTRRVPDTVVRATSWPPFVIASLVMTLTAGALTGAFDVWALRVSQHAVPLDHHRAHGLAQLFGFLGLFLMGLSLHLAPRFFGAAPPPASRVRRLQWLAISAVVLVVLGRFGRLVPGSRWLGLVGGVALVAAQVDWASLVGGWALTSPGFARCEAHRTGRRCARCWAAGLWGRGFELQRYVLAGVAWWVMAAATFFAWQVGWPVPLEAVWAPALFGGVMSWMLGVFFRAGVCTLRLARPTEVAQQRLWLVWQSTTSVSVAASWAQLSWLDAVASVALAVAVLWVWVTLRPFSGEGVSGGPLTARALQAGFLFLALFAVLQGWNALGEIGVWTPPLLHDASRHVFTLGGATLFLIGFAGRMVPGFRGVTLQWSRAYDAGVLAVIAGASLRVLEVTGLRVGLVLSGISGALAFAGLALVSSALLRSLARRPSGV